MDKNYSVWPLYLLALCYLTNLVDSQCTQGAVRLASISYNRQSTSGIVEICSLGQWGRVCGAYSYNFGTNEAKVICRQLGYSDRGALARTQSYSYRSSSTILLTRGLNCYGNETNWLDCNLQPPYSSTCYNGRTNYNAGVQCSPAPTLQVSITTVPRPISGIALAGTSLTMTCTVSPYTTGIETYHWSSSCTGNCFVRGASTPVLQRDVLRVDDSGRHTCTVTRGSSSRQSTLTLTVIEPAISIAISPPFTGMDSPPYEHFTLWCNASTPTRISLPTVITWYKDGGAIDVDSESMVVESVSRCSDRNCSALIVNDAVTSFSGEYMCVARVVIPGSRTVSKIATTTVVIHASTEAIIQLHLTGVHHCKDWVFIEAHEKAADISELLTQAIQERCNCDFSLERLEDSGLVCTEDLNEIVYQARILSIPQASSHQLVVIVTQIVNTEGQTFVVRGLRLNVVPNCAVMTDSFIEVSCEGYDMSGSGNGVLTPYSMYVYNPIGSQASSTSTVIAITEGMVIFVVVVIAISACLIGILLRRRKSGRFTRLTNHSDHSVNFESETGVTISGGLHFRPTTSRAVSDIYEELPLKPDQDDN